MRVLFAVIFAVCVFVRWSWADTYTYTYTGQPYTFVTYTSTNDFLSVSVTLGSPLPPNLSEPGSLEPAVVTVTPLAFSFSDGKDTITNTSPGTFSSQYFEFATDASGAIEYWSVGIDYLGSGGEVGMLTHLEYSPSGAFSEDFVFGAPQQAFSFTPGTWVETVNSTAVVPGAMTPEPGSLFLAATGMAGIAGLRWRRI